MFNNLKKWQGWLIFLGTMVIVFLLGLAVSSLLERRAEVANLFNNRKTKITGIEARNEMFAQDFPRQYETWKQTADTSFRSEFNSSSMDDVLAMRPNMVILWAGYAFSKDYSSPRGHMYAVEDVRHTLRTGAPDKIDDGSPQPAT